MVATMVRLVDTLVSGFDVLDLVHDLLDASKELLDVAEAGLLLIDERGALRVAATSSETTRTVGLLELEQKSGPGSEAFHSATVVATGPLTDSTTEGRWPDFVAAARAAGFRAAVAIPMRLRGDVLGALDLLLSDRDDLPEAELAIAQALADVSTIAILQDRLAVDDRTVISQLRTALDTRVRIEQAKGVIARDGMTMDEAFGRIRSYARNNNKRLADVASAIVAGELAPSQFV